ncbi:MAG: glycoside hydrolase family 2 TIM barrel-domain containing protein [Cyclobacteriaceae bacterium]|nr:glycoside hydrolase family 2 TIM barrel-domain containing protein [Cyclobacteriaceae bacterium]
MHAEEKTTIDLSGEWQFQIDSLDEGVANRWFATNLEDKITLPGSMTTNGKGDEISLKTPWTGGIVDSSWFHADKYARYREPGNIKIPFWLQPVKYYAGAAWYNKTVEIPASWTGKYISLFLERCHWETMVWVDGVEVGMQNSLATPHNYNLSSLLSPGKHTISIRVDNRIKEVDPGINSHSIADHTQSNWNGIVGKIVLEAKPAIYVEDFRIFPNVARGKVMVKGTIGNITNDTPDGEITISTVLNKAGADAPKTRVFEPISALSNGKEFTYEFSMGDELGIWDEFYPNTYTMLVKLESTTGTHEDSVLFGMRNIAVDSTWFTINDRPIFIRGTLECAIFPKTGYPPTDVDSWKRIMNVAKVHGLNSLRFHSWCPPEAAFITADEVGLYLQIENSSWANQSTTLGDGKPIDQYVYDESERIVKAYGNHPSFCLMSYGNEPGGINHANYLADFVEYWKAKDSRRLYTGGAGWPALQENQYQNTPEPRIQAWGAGLASSINSMPPTTDFDWSEILTHYQGPVVSHEIGQWCVYPNFKEINKYDGVLKAKNFEIFQESLIENGMGNLADSFLLASGKLQTLCYKADIEAALRTPGMAGFQLLDLHDFPGQGTALVGVLDPFWEEKGYVTPQEYSRFCNSTVPLARMKKRVFTSDEEFTATLEVAHFGPEVLPDASSGWWITDQKGDTLFDGKFDEITIPQGNGIHLGTVGLTLKNFPGAAQLTLHAYVNDFVNDWDFWVFPETLEQVEGVMMVSSITDDVLKKLAEGGLVLWSIPESAKSPYLNDGVGFSSIFWNTAWTGGQLPNSLGILCDPAHAAFHYFPTQYHSNWQWWDAMSHSNGIRLDGFSSKI